jgi:putative transposase
LTLAHYGSKAYSEGFDLVHRREAPRANAIWQADHAQLSILLLREDGQTARPWLTIVIDDYSRAIAGYYLGFDPPSSMRTALALRQGIWRKGHPHWHICGIPEVLYTDNGSDFMSKHLEQVAVDLKIRLVFSTPGKPQGRGRIERFFRTVNSMFLCELDGFIRRKRHKPTLSLERLEELFQSFLLETYPRRISVKGRLVPSERWEEGGFLPRMPESLEQLDLLLMQEVRARKVRRDGIHFHGLRYLSLRTSIRRPVRLCCPEGLDGKVAASFATTRSPGRNRSATSDRARCSILPWPSTIRIFALDGRWTGR